MTRSAPAAVPLLPTLLVTAAVALMIGLGIWQLGRAQWKGELLVRYGQATAMPSQVAWPRGEAEAEAVLFRSSSFICDRVLSRRVTAAASAQGRRGLAQVALCALDGGGEAEVALGWSRDLEEAPWNGGPVAGVIAPGPRLVAIPPQGGLEALAPPDPADIPNNHLAYAGQWFFFALTAIVIYVLALRRRWRQRAGDS